jgi:acetolactate synthase-1/2/3 large subunit
MKISNLIANTLEEKGITHIFTYPGGTIAHLLDSISKTKIRIVTTRHEQGASFSASAYSKANNGLGVCLATSGPGVTNLITGIADAYYDYTPMLVITGQVGSNFLIDNNKRQNGFQQIDTLDIVKSITVYNTGIYKIDDDIVNKIDTAINTAYNKLGPSLIDVPIDIQKANI